MAALLGSVLTGAAALHAGTVVRWVERGGNCRLSGTGWWSDGWGGSGRAQRTRGALREPDGIGGGGGSVTALAVHTVFVFTTVAVARVELDDGHGRIRDRAGCDIVGGMH